jgi:glucose-6-phosphate 1-dehydrogenase
VAISLIILQMRNIVSILFLNNLTPKTKTNAIIEEIKIMLGIALSCHGQGMNNGQSPITASVTASQPKTLHNYENICLEGSWAISRDFARDQEIKTASIRS